MPGGRSGLVLSPDPNQTSFKQSLIAIVFAGIYLEALLHIEGTHRLGSAYKDGWKYEEKLAALGAPPALIEAGQQFRETRNAALHEKASKPSELRSAQGEARKAVAFVEAVASWIEDSAQNR